MFDQVLSTIQLQQEMFRQWFQQWPRVLRIPWMRERVRQIRQALLGEGRPMTPSADYLDLLHSGTLEDAFRVAEAKDPAQFCKLTEELWRNSFDCCSKTAMEEQLRELRAAMRRGSRPCPGGDRR